MSRSLGTLCLSLLCLTLAAPAQSAGSCFILGLNHTGEGNNPLVDPSSSPGCQFHEYAEGTLVTLTAQPDPGWEVRAWSGTDDDASTATFNTITMPADLHFVTVDYAPICLTLSLGHSGMGGDPVAIPLGDGSTWDRHEVANQCDVWGLAAGDIDGDGDVDAFGGLAEQFGTSDVVVWWENVTGDATAWISHEIGNGLDWPISVDGADFDGDGDVDVTGAMLVDSRVLWWRNTNGDGTSWAPGVVADPVGGALDVVAVDMDGDGDPDIAGASRDTDRLLWWENVNGGTSWIEHEVANGFDGADAVSPADFDGDGDMDLAGISHNSDELGWFENLDGTGTSWASHILTSGQADFEFADEVEAADLNGDGEPDILAVAFLGDVVRWWENLGGASGFLERDIATFADARAARPADLDLDGDLDVVGQGDDGVMSWRNRDGTATSWTQVPIESPYINGLDVLTTDFDGDGDIDVIGSEIVPCGVDIWLNTYDGSCPAGELQPMDLVQVTASPDPGWQVAGWSGTEDDTSTELTNFARLPTVDHEVLVHYEEIDPFDFSLVVSGACPGLLTMTIAGATPNARLAVFAGNAGSSTLAQGPCAGTEIDLGTSRLLIKSIVDSNGDLVLQRTVNQNLCGRQLQAVDISTCGVSNPELVP